MKWFAGSVSTAIQISRKNNALFIVFIESKNGKGERMRELWDKVESSLFDCPVVGIHLIEGDEAAKQFSQIYPTPVLPASYIIDNFGKPIEIITLLKDLDFDEFFTKINNSVKVFCASAKSGQKNENSVQAGAGSSTDEVLLASTSTSPSSLGEISVEERVQRAKALLEQKRANEEARKQEEEKKRELERINSGKLMQEAQKKRHEQELLEAAAQRRRDKIEAERERERLKAQIKADREEREFRERRGISVVDNTPTMQNAMPKPEPLASDRCRVQVRLPNGENIVEEFPSSDCLCTLVELVKQDGRVSGSFSLAQVFPRKVFTESELEKSFLDLSLTPTCTLLIIQSQGKSSHVISARPFGGIFHLFSLLIFSPLRSIYNVVGGWLGWRPGTGLSTTSHSKQTKQDETKRQREPQATGATVRRRGNMSRLHNTNDDPDEENANWNGNSTQFL